MLNNNTVTSIEIKLNRFLRVPCVLKMRYAICNEDLLPSLRPASICSGVLSVGTSL